jgi:hypothetical protein
VGAYQLKKEKERQIALMDDLLVPEPFREDIIRVLKYGLAHTVPTAPQELSDFILAWCAKEERKIDVFEGRIEEEPEEELSSDPEFVGSPTIEGMEGL